jgi:hypothetical protein
MDAAKAAAKAAESINLDEDFLNDEDDEEVESATVAAMNKDQQMKKKQYDASSDRMQR